MLTDQISNPYRTGQFVDIHIFWGSAGSLYQLLSNVIFRQIVAHLLSISSLLFWSYMLLFAMIESLG